MHTEKCGNEKRCYMRWVVYFIFYEHLGTKNSHCYSFTSIVRVEISYAKYMCLCMRACVCVWLQMPGLVKTTQSIESRGQRQALSFGTDVLRTVLGNTLGRQPSHKRASSRKTA